MILYRGVPGFATDCICGVWCRGLPSVSGSIIFQLCHVWQQRYSCDGFSLHLSAYIYMTVCYLDDVIPIQILTRFYETINPNGFQSLCHSIYDNACVAIKIFNLDFENALINSFITHWFRILFIIAKNTRYLRWNRGAWQSHHNIHQTFLTRVFGAPVIYVIPVACLT